MPSSEPDSPEGEDGSLEAPEEATYEGTLPCGDCEGILTTLSLQPSKSEPGQVPGSIYILNETYLGSQQSPLETTGGWILQKGLFSRDDNDVNVAEDLYIVLDPAEPEKRRVFLVQGIDMLVEADENGESVTSSNAILTRMGSLPTTYVRPAENGLTAAEAARPVRDYGPPPSPTGEAQEPSL